MVGVLLGCGVAEGVGVSIGDSPPGGISGGNVGGGICTSRQRGAAGGVGDGRSETSVAVGTVGGGVVGVGDGVQVDVGGEGSACGSTPGGTTITPGVWGGGVMTTS